MNLAYRTPICGWCTLSIAKFTCWCFMLKCCQFIICEKLIFCLDVLLVVAKHTSTVALHDRRQIEGGTTLFEFFGNYLVIPPSCQIYCLFLRYFKIWTLRSMWCHVIHTVNITLDSKAIETFCCLIQLPQHFQSTNTNHMSLEVLDSDFVKQTCASTYVNAKSRALIFMIYIGGSRSGLIKLRK